MRLNSDDFVREQYRTTENLETRISVWRVEDAAKSPQDVALIALSDAHPRCVLEVGSGTGSLAVRMTQEIGCEVVALDSSEAMVAASSALGITTILADVRKLPFPKGSFDAVVAAWMLYHVFPLDQALSELSRVLRPGGKLIAITNGRDHLEELWRAVGTEHDEPSFSAENGAEQLRAYFSEVERHDVATYAMFPDRNTAVAYLRSIDQDDLIDGVPHSGWPLRAGGATAVFFADRPK